MFAQAALNGVLSGLNHLLHQASWARERLAPHAGRRVRVLLPLGSAPASATGSPLSSPGSPAWKFDFSIDETGLLAAESFAEADVDIELPADAPLRALRGQEELFRGVRLRGSAELAEVLNFVLPRLRWDIEEDLSKLVGDIAAQRLVQGVRGFADWQRETVERLGQNVAEYLTEEQPLLAKRADLALFSADLAQLMRSLQELEAHVQRVASAA